MFGLASRFVAGSVVRTVSGMSFFSAPTSSVVKRAPDGSGEMGTGRCADTGGVAAAAGSDARRGFVVAMDKKLSVWPQALTTSFASS